MKVNAAPLKPASLKKVRLTGGLLGDRATFNQHKVIPAIYRQLEHGGPLSALAAVPKGIKEIDVHPYWDSDVAKWLEAASYVLSVQTDTELEALVEKVISLVAAAQGEDGYLNTYYTLVQPENRFKHLAFGHELYNAGHLIEAAVAHYEATGNSSLLNVAIRYADHIMDVFNPHGRNGYPGHPEIELALVRLFRATGNRDYLELSRCFLNRRGQKPSVFEQEIGTLPPDHLELFDHLFGSGDSFSTAYCQDHLPVVQQTEAVGHAVRAMYLYAAMVDVSVETGDEAMLDTCRRLWHDVVKRRMYVTGGIGSSRHNEGFTDAYDLPNLDAYAETCAAIGLALFSHRLLQIEPYGEYADVLERVIYNAILGGASLDDSLFFYDNPLESRGDHHRQQWFEVACCPPNWSRFVGSLGRYMYSHSSDAIFVHLYNSGSGQMKLDTGVVRLQQKTNYPWEGSVEIRIACDESAAFSLNLRIPGWTRDFAVCINGVPVNVEKRPDKGYLSVNRTWQPGDLVHLKFTMPIERIHAHPAVKADVGRVALQRGPLVYCLEQVDHDVPISEILIGDDDRLVAEFRPSLLGGVVAITGVAQTVDESDWPDALYLPVKPKTKPCRLVAVPFYTWDNRTQGAMQVWTRTHC